MFKVSSIPVSMSRIHALSSLLLLPSHSIYTLSLILKFAGAIQHRITILTETIAWNFETRPVYLCVSIHLSFFYSPVFISLDHMAPPVYYVFIFDSSVSAKHSHETTLFSPYQSTPFIHLLFIISFLKTTFILFSVPFLLSF